MPTLAEMLRQGSFENPNNPYSSNLLADALRGSLSNAESLGRGAAVAPLGIFGDVNALAREYLTPRLPAKLQAALESLPAAPTTEAILANIPRGTEARRESSGMEQLGAAMNPVGPVEVAKGITKGLGAYGKLAGEAINDAMVYGRGPLAEVTPQPMRMVEQTESTFKFPQEEAMRLAQQRAALPIEESGLGLKPNNTAAERAAAQGGKEAIHFSRTGGDFNMLDSGQYAVAPFDAVGTHVGTKEAALDRFRNTSGTIDTPKGSTYPVQILGDKPLMNQNGMPWGEDDLNAFLRKEGGHNWSDVNGGKMTYQQMNSALRKKLFDEQGYTSIPYFNEVEGKGSISYIVPPENLRSRFAAFDPWRRTAATAAAMGVAAPDLLAKERK